MSALVHAFNATKDLAAWRNGEKRNRWRDAGGKHKPCIPPAVLRGMADRIQLRARVERDEREEALPSR